MTATTPAGARLDAVPETEAVPACVLCGSAGATWIGVTRDRFHALPGEFGLWRCDECGLVRLSPRPTPGAIGFYYPDEYFELFYPADGGGAADGEPGRGGRARHAVGARLASTVLATAGYPRGAARPLPRPLWPIVVPLYRRRVFFDYLGFPRWEGAGRALDVGCSTGAFLACLKHVGWEVAGVEPDAHAAAVTQAKLGCEVFVGEVEDADFEPGRFDFANLRHVVEHMYDPPASLRAVGGLVRPGGLVYIEVPNAAGVGTRQCGEYWYGWDSPRHLQLFTPDTLRLLVAAAGLEIERMATFPLRDVFKVEDTFRQEEGLGRLLGQGPSGPSERGKAPGPSGPFPGAPTGTFGSGGVGSERGNGRRFRLRARRRPRAAALRAAARVRRMVDPLSGDVLACWARARR